MTISLIHEERAYENWVREQEAQCGCPWTGGPAHDPYGTECDLPKGHEGDHSGPDPFGRDEPLTWDHRRGARERMRRYE
jgi:hypothetical protein